MSEQGDIRMEGIRSSDVNYTKGAEISPRSEKTADTPPFLVRFTQQDRPVFDNLTDKLSILHLMRNVRVLAERYERRGGTFTDPEKRLMDVFAANREDQQRLGRDLHALNLQFRWATANDNISVDQLIEDAYEHGGNVSTITSPWAHIGSASDVKDFMKREVIRGKPGVLFVYDGSKLTTKPQDNENDIRSRYYYTKRAIPGLELKDAMLGMIGFNEI